MPPSSNSDDRAGTSAGQLAHLAAAGLLAAAGGLHLAALPGHWAASTVAGAFFAVTAAVQLLGAVSIAARPSSKTVLAVVAGNVAVLTLWAMSRTTGLPTGGELGVREPFGLLDGSAAAVEVLVIVAGLLALVHRSPRTARQAVGWRPALALALAWGISGGAGLAVAHDGHHHPVGQVHSRTVPGEHSHGTEPTTPGDAR